MSIYYQLQERVIKSKLNTKEVNTKNVALWQTVGLLTDQEFIDLMALIDTEYQDETIE
mgnify:CR=1 FL=1